MNVITTQVYDNVLEQKTICSLPKFMNIDFLLQKSGHSYVFVPYKLYCLLLTVYYTLIQTLY